MKRDGWRQWYGARDIGVSRWEGIGQGGASSATDATAPALKDLDATLRKVDTSASQAANSLGSGGGGLFGALAKLFGGGEGTATAVTAAGGGHIRGPGTSTSDSILARLSDGELVVNAAATARHLPVLHAMNANRLPAFAAGGPVGRPVSALSSGQSGLVVNVVNNHSGAEVAAREVPDGRGGRRLDVQVDEAVAGAVGRPGSRTSAAMAQSRLVTG